MTARRFALLLVLYVSLDFANPLMPGAVQFVDGAIDVVHADRAAPEDLVLADSVVQVRAPDAPPEVSPRTWSDRRPRQRRLAQYLIPPRQVTRAQADLAEPSEDH